jgi:hypothetical protein
MVSALVQDKGSKRTSGILRALSILLLQVLLGLAVVFAGGEIWARSALGFEGKHWPMRFDSAFGFNFKPHETVRHTNFVDFQTSETANADGFLDRPFPALEKPSGVCRIAFIGDSFVEAAQVRNEHKLQVVFERLARERWPHLAIETMATGYSGTGQLNQVPFYDLWVAPRKPDVVVLVFVSNDFANNSAVLEAVRNGWHPLHMPRLFANKTSTGEIVLQPIDPNFDSHTLLNTNGSPAKWHRWLHRLSYFYRWVFAQMKIQNPAATAQLTGTEDVNKLYVDRAEQLVRLSPEYARKLSGWDMRKFPKFNQMFQQEPLIELFQDAIDYTEFAFDQFYQRIRRDNARPVVISAFNVEGRHLKRLNHMLDERAIEHASQADAVVAQKIDRRKLHFSRDGHWNAEGHRHAAVMLLDWFAKTSPCG